MARPSLFFGRRNVAAVVRAGESQLDHTEPFNLFAKTNKVAPAGSGGECIFTLVYLTVTFYQGLTLYLTPYVDDTQLEEIPVELVAKSGNPKQTKVYEIGVSIPLYGDDDSERGRYAARGTWFQLAIESAFAGAGVPLTIEQVEVDWEPVEESKTILGGATP